MRDENVYQMCTFQVWLTTNTSQLKLVFIWLTPLTSKPHALRANRVRVSQTVRVEHLEFNAIFLKSGHDRVIPLLQPGLIQAVSQDRSRPGLLYELFKSKQRRSTLLSISLCIQEDKLAANAFQR